MVFALQSYENACIISPYVGFQIRVTERHFYNQLKIKCITTKIDF